MASQRTTTHKRIRAYENPLPSHNKSRRFSNWRGDTFGVGWPVISRFFCRCNLYSYDGKFSHRPLMAKMHITMAKMHITKCTSHIHTLKMHTEHERWTSVLMIPNNRDIDSRQDPSWINVPSVWSTVPLRSKGHVGRTWEVWYLKLGICNDLPFAYPKFWPLWWWIFWRCAFFEMCHLYVHFWCAFLWGSWFAKKCILHRKMHIFGKISPRQKCTSPQNP